MLNIIISIIGAMQDDMAGHMCKCKKLFVPRFILFQICVKVLMEPG